MPYPPSQRLTVWTVSCLDKSEGAVARGWFWIQVSPRHEHGVIRLAFQNLSFICKMGKQMLPFGVRLRYKCKTADTERHAGLWGYSTPLSTLTFLQSPEDTCFLTPHGAGVKKTWNLLIFFIEIIALIWVSSFFLWAAFQIWVSCEAWMAAYLAESVE